MRIFNIIKSAFIFNRELKNIQEAYPELFKFLEEYGYVPINIRNIEFDDNFHASTSIFPDTGEICDNYDRVIKFIIGFRREADLITIAKEFKNATNQELFIPSEIAEDQYIAIYGWKYYKSYDKNYKASIVFGLGEEWCPPIFRDGTIKINHYFSTGGYIRKIYNNISKEVIIKYYSYFIKEAVGDLVRDIKWSYENFKYPSYGWYLKKMIPKYKDKIPSLYWKDGEVTIPQWNRRESNDNTATFLTKSSIVQSWSLLDFVREYGKPKLAHCKDQNTEEEFTCIVFGEVSNRMFVSFSSEIGELTSQEISERKNQLKVAKQVKEGKENYILYE